MNIMATPFSSHKIEEAVRHVFPAVKVLSIVAVPTKSPLRLFRLTLSHPETNLLLSMPMPSNVRLLRHENNLVHDEATLLTFLAKTTMPDNLQKIAPDLIKHCSSARDLGTSYNIVTSIGGTPLYRLSGEFTAAEKCKIHTELGTLQRQFSTIVSPTAKFGRVSEVCAGAGFGGWTEAFMALLESVLRDGEDMSVNIPYERIRWHAARGTWALDEVVVARLVVLDAEDSEKVLVTQGGPHGVHIHGIQNWTQGIFGDPMILKCFEDPSQEFLKAWQTQQDTGVGKIEESKARLLLYACWRAVVEIVTEYVRPQSGSSARELEARKKLTNVLFRLDGCKNVEDEEQPRRYSKNRLGPCPETKSLLDKSLQPCSPVPFVILNSI